MPPACPACPVEFHARCYCMHYARYFSSPLQPGDGYAVAGGHRGDMALGISVFSKERKFPPGKPVALNREVISTLIPRRP